MRSRNEVRSDGNSNVRSPKLVDVNVPPDERVRSERYHPRDGQGSRGRRVKLVVYAQRRANGRTVSTDCLAALPNERNRSAIGPLKSRYAGTAVVADVFLESSHAEIS